MSTFEYSSSISENISLHTSAAPLLAQPRTRRRTTSGTEDSSSFLEQTRTISLMDNRSWTSNDRGGRPPKPPRKGFSIWKLLRILLILFIILLLLGGGAVAFLFFKTSMSLPPFDPQKLYSASNSFMYDAAGNLIYELHSGENRRTVDLEQVPKEMLWALLATEDRNFYTHHGIDLKGIARSFVSNLLSKQLSQGASTITQQLARQSYLTLEKTYERKIKEIILSFKIESQFSKDEILAFYLNKMNFGAGSYGVESAAETYFGKSVSELDLPQSAMIIGLLQAPSAYNPLLYYDKAKARQKTVIRNMINAGYISEATGLEAMEADVHLLAEGESSPYDHYTDMSSSYGFYIDAVIEEALDILSNLGVANPEEGVYSGGLSIYCNLDEHIQDKMNAVYADSSYFPDITYNGLPVQSASVIVENQTGKVVALTGGREYTAVRGFNRATQALRQPGSCIKPLTVYSPALESGIMPVKVFEDAPISYPQRDGTVWKPANYDGSFKGKITMRTAVQWSVNTYAIQLLDEIGVRTGFDYGTKLGLPLVSTGNMNDLGLAPLALGGLTQGVTPVQMAGAYAALGNRGVYNQPYLVNQIYDENGALIYSYKDKHTSKQVFTTETAWLMTSMLETVTESGTGTPAKLDNVPTAGKTGTSEEKSNAWFCGYTPQYACSVWFGFDEVHAMPGVYGSDAAKIFRAVLTTAHENIAPGSFDYKPDDIISVKINKYDGNLASSSTPSSSIISEYCIDRYAPKEYSSSGSSYSNWKRVEVCANTGLLPSEHCPVITDSFAPEDIPTEYCTSCTGDNHHATSPENTEPSTSNTYDNSSGDTMTVPEPPPSPAPTTPVTESAPPAEVVVPASPADSSFGDVDPFANTSAPVGMVVDGQ